MARKPCISVQKSLEKVKKNNKTSLNLLSVSFNVSPLWEMFQEGIDLKSIKWTQH